MSSQVNRLQALLQRVEDNRKKPRAAAVATPAPELRPAPAARAAPAPAAAPVRAAPPPEQRPKPKAATPLEMAVEGRMSQPVSPQPEVKRPMPQTTPKIAAVAAPVSEGVLLVEGTMAEPSKPIVHVVSKHPPSTALSFGDLLRRSLSLRPR